MKTVLGVSLILAGASPSLWPQAAPAATGPRQMSIPGSIDYSLRASQVSDFYPGGRTQQSVNLSGNLDYQNASEREPFNAKIGVGYQWRVSGVNYGSGLFENLGLSQAVIRENWNLEVGDQFRYWRQTPATDFGGQSDTGQLNTISPDDSAIAIQTVIINNTASANYNHEILTGSEFTFKGGQTLVRFPDGNGFDMNSYQAHPSIAWRLNALNSIDTGYSYSRYDYIDSNLTLSANAVLAGYDRQWTRRLHTSLSGGPEWVSSTNPLLEPGTLSYQANGEATYEAGRTSAYLKYTHGFYGGGGSLRGGFLEVADGSLQHEFQNRLSVSFVAGYRHMQTLNDSGVISTKFATVQANRHFGRRISAYVSYMANAQSSSATVPSGTLNGLWQRISVGVSFTSAPIHLRF